MKKKHSRHRIDMNVEELDRIIDGGKSAPLSESDSHKLKTALHALAERLMRPPKTEKPSAVFDDQNNAEPEQAQPDPDKAIGHGRKIRSSYTAIAVPTAPEATSIGRRSRERWCGSRGRPRWPPLFTNWNSCAAMLVGRCSRRQNRKTWVRRSTTKQRQP